MPLKYTDCTLVIIMANIVLSIKCLQKQAAGCVLTSSPRSVDVKSYFQISCECVAFIADLLLYHSLCPHTLQHWVLALPYLHVQMKPQLVSIIHEIRSDPLVRGERKCVTTAGLYIRIATCLPITTVVCLYLPILFLKLTSSYFVMAPPKYVPRDLTKTACVYCLCVM